MSPDAKQNFLQWARSTRWLMRQAKRGPTVLVASAPSQGVIVNVVEEEEAGPVEVAVNWAGIWVGRVSVEDEPDFVKSIHEHARANLVEEDAILTEVSRWLYPR